MKTKTIALPTLAAIAATRGILGIGIGLLLSPRIVPSQRRALGWTLLGIGLASTIPLAAIVFHDRSGRRLPENASNPSA
jgi:hypothetical protein